MNRTHTRTSQGGSVLLEALFAILIFSFGVLGILGLQTDMIVGAADAKYRNEASFYASRLISQMWSASRGRDSASMVVFQNNFKTGGPSYTDWYNDMLNASATAGLLRLPGADINPPTVTIANANIDTVTGLPTTFDVLVTVKWQKTLGKPVHQHVVAASVSVD